jgi:hypothetical protein
MPARIRTLAAVAATLLLMSVPVRGALGPGSRAGVLPNFDIRSDRRSQAEPAAPEVRAAVEAVRAEAGTGADVRLTPRGTVRTIASRGAALGTLAPGDRAAALQAFLARHHRAFGLDRDDLASLVLTRDASSRSDGLTHLDFEQRVGGLRVFGAGVRVHLTGTGDVVRVSSTAVPTGGRGTQPALSAAEAVELAVAAVRPDLAFTPGLVQGPAGPSRESAFAPGPLKSGPVAALLLFPLADDLRAAWHVVVEPPGLPQKYDVLIDAVSGELLYRRNRVLYAEGTGRVLQSEQAHARDPRLADEHPAGSAPTTDSPWGCPPAANHFVRNLTAPFRDQGTVLSGTGRLQGNNAHVFRGMPGLEGAFGSSSQGGGWSFDFEFGSAEDFQLTQAMNQLKGLPGVASVKAVSAQAKPE